jgi:hypothetical protein
MTGLMGTNHRGAHGDNITTITNENRILSEKVVNLFT